ncbi:MAG: hypothetical protein AAF559_03410 [Pseudomonadota bacterium]
MTWLIVDAVDEEEVRMDYTVVLSVWAVSVAAPCVLSWLAGDVVGSARTRRAMTANRLAQAEALAMPQAGLDGGKSLPRLAPHAAQPMRAALVRPEEEMSFEEQAREAERRRERREAFARMPALSDLRAHVEAIRLSESPLRTCHERTRNHDEDTTRFGRILERRRHGGLTHFECSVRAVQSDQLRAAGPAQKGRAEPAARTSPASTECNQPSPVLASPSLTRV